MTFQSEFIETNTLVRRLVNNKYELVPLCAESYKNVEYIVDDSSFIPMSEAVKALGSGNFGGRSDLFYDFKNGRDDGRRITPAKRREGLAETYVDTVKTTSEITKEAKEQSAENAAAAKFEAEKAEKAAKAAAKNAATSNSSTESAEA